MSVFDITNLDSSIAVRQLNKLIQDSIAKIHEESERNETSIESLEIRVPKPMYALIKDMLEKRSFQWLPNDYDEIGFREPCGDIIPIRLKDGGREDYIQIKYEERAVRVDCFPLILSLD